MSILIKTPICTLDEDMAAWKRLKASMLSIMMLMDPGARALARVTRRGMEDWGTGTPYSI